jgi:hypothetical protein
MRSLKLFLPVAIMLASVAAMQSCDGAGGGADSGRPRDGGKPCETEQDCGFFEW